MNRTPVLTATRARGAIFFFLAVALLLAAPQVVAVSLTRGSGEKLHVGRTAMTRNGTYVVDLLIPPPASSGDWEAWYLRVQDPTGAPVHDGVVRFQVWHPRTGEVVRGPVTASYQRVGRYRMDGMRLPSGGDWFVGVQVHGPAGADSVRFEIHRK